MHYNSPNTTRWYFPQPFNDRVTLGNFKCLTAEFEKQLIELQNKMNCFFKGVYFLNLAALLCGLGYVTVKHYHLGSVTITFGEQLWNDSISTLLSREYVFVILFKGVYCRNGTWALLATFIFCRQFSGAIYVWQFHHFSRFWSKQHNLLSCS